MLESIGMTRKQRRNMILSECFTLAGANILGTLLAGTGAGYLLCSILVKTGSSYMAFRFPLWFVLAYAAVLIIVPTVITIAAMRGFAREVLTERLRGMEG